MRLGVVVANKHDSFVFCSRERLLVLRLRLAALLEKIYPALIEHYLDALRQQVVRKFVAHEAMRGVVIVHLRVAASRREVAQMPSHLADRARNPVVLLLNVMLAPLGERWHRALLNFLIFGQPLNATLVLHDPAP